MIIPSHQEAQEVLSHREITIIAAAVLHQAAAEAVVAVEVVHL